MIDLIIDLAPDESAEAAIQARAQPQQRIHEVNPDSTLHEGDARALVVAAIALEEDRGEGAEECDPQHEQNQVPGE